MTRNEVQSLGIDPDSAVGRSMTAPKGLSFRASLEELPIQWADSEDQLHVELADPATLGDVKVAWDTLALACHVRDLKAYGYVDHVIEADGQKTRCIRLILKPEEVH